ncbi:CBS domain-containing protein [Streptomyces sp. NPDC091281]|uniref:CBS domain-containing protein n=1 Tax=Streptomyces sp. NPDC091281 TaxID=3365985 RepID=UPI003817C3B1
MNHQSVRDVMSNAVVTVQAGTPFKEIAHLLLEYDITAVPVVDAANRPVGVVSEADLLQKMWGRQESETGETGTGGTGTGGTGGEGPGADSPGPGPVARPAKTWATDAAGLMTSPAVSAREDWSVVDAARVMARHGVKRLLVVDEAERLIGVVSRSDLLRIFVRSDQAIRTEIVEEVLVRTLGEAPSALQVDVTHGQVVLSGRLSSGASVEALEELCRSVDGVVAVEFRPVREAGADVTGVDVSRADGPQAPAPRAVDEPERD